MLDILVFGLVAGHFAAWLITLADKRGWLATLQTNAPNDTIWTLFTCRYCMSWWISLTLMLAASFVTGNWWLLFGALVGTMVGKNLAE